MTVEACQSFCLGVGFTLAGMEDGNECWCSDSLSNGATQANAGDCSTTCAGNSNELCGGGWRLSVYQYIAGASTTSTTATSTSTSSAPTSTPTGWSAIGCYTDANARTLPSDATSSNSMTVEACQSFCLGAGFTLAGTEDGNECWCSDSISNGGTQASAGDCSTTCAGNSNEQCGGGWRLSVYQYNAGTTSPPVNGWSSVGCWVDSNSRALPSDAESSSSLTTEACQTFCGNAGYTYAGTEDGNECWCSNSISNGATQASAGDCSTPCAGNSGEICGGGWRLSVYQK
ncbi:WSC-domain-containing protein [Calocera viscosa TUFC12733]|uniref:WSC-domain-containing protein n=1 Tax=Calocera viscosa (strain TUFC12733) TaxID=1330018 RepID=A0A167QBA1_CALVF|nr:WSC-domain-containing protein [Calocera viscosa TUFC12733]